MLVAGGQDAADVTTTGAGAGKFEVRIFDKIHANELGTVKGHFGPVNVSTHAPPPQYDFRVRLLREWLWLQYVKYNPQGTAYVSGGEEGFLRVNHLPAEYFGLGQED